MDGIGRKIKYFVRSEVGTSKFSGNTHNSNYSDFLKYVVDMQTVTFFKVCVSVTGLYSIRPL